MKQINAAVLLFVGIMFGISFVYSCGGGVDSSFFNGSAVDAATVEPTNFRSILFSGNSALVYDGNTSCDTTWQPHSGAEKFVLTDCTVKYAGPTSNPSLIGDKIPVFQDYETVTLGTGVLFNAGEPVNIHVWYANSTTCAYQQVFLSGYIVP